MVHGGLQWGVNRTIAGFRAGLSPIFPGIDLRVFFSMDLADWLIVMGFGLFIGLALVLYLCDWWCTRASENARREARELRDENLDRVIAWFLTRAVDVDRRIRGGPRPPVRGNWVTHVPAPAPANAIARDRDMTRIPMLTWDQA